MITKLKLTNFKNFKETEINFGPVSILLGTNATGKSNVRDAFRFLHGIARGYTLAEIIGGKYGEGGQLEWSGIRGGTREICFSGQQTFSVEIEFVQKEGSTGPLIPYAYKIEVNCGSIGSAPKVVRESLYRDGAEIYDTPGNSCPGDEFLLFTVVRLPSGESYEEDWPPLLAGQPLLWQAKEKVEEVIVAAPGNILVRPFADVLTAVKSALQELESIRFIDFSPELMRKPSIPGQPILSDRGDNLSSVLQAICKTPELKRALSNWIQELTPMDVVDFEFESDAEGKILVYLVEEAARRTSANSASDGTLRFLGMLAALLGPKPARFYFLEEIDNGIHPARLALLMDLLDNQSAGKDIQIVATTHSPQVLRLVKHENLKYATLAYRLRGSREGRLIPLADVPNLMDVIKNKDIARLHESSWMENTMEFSEGKAKMFPIENQDDPR